jgi:small-conductance mechanosensitive channel
VEGEWGTIEEITLTYVIMRLWDKRRLVVPITYFVEKIFQNWTRNSFEVIGTVFLQLDHTTPIEKTRAALDRILEKTDLWDGQVKNLAVTDANSQTIELRILVSAINSGNLWDLRCHVREQLIDFLQREHPGSLPKSRLTIREKQ